MTGSRRIGQAIEYYLGIESIADANQDADKYGKPDSCSQAGGKEFHHGVVSKEFPNRISSPHLG